MNEMLNLSSLFSFEHVRQKLFLGDLDGSGRLYPGSDFDLYINEKGVLVCRILGEDVDPQFLDVLQDSVYLEPGSDGTLRGLKDLLCYLDLEIDEYNGYLKFNKE